MSDLSIRELVSNNSPLENLETFTTLPLDKLLDYSNHPFKVIKDNKYYELVASISDVGVINPIIVRKIPDSNNYEILAGHRRTHASRECKLVEIPVRIVKCDDSLANLIVTITNLTQRENLLPSEKAFAYKMQLDTLNQQGKRTDLMALFDEKFTLSHDGTKFNAGTEMSKKYNESRTNIYRYIRLASLNSDLLNLIDENNLSLVSGVELSYLTSEQQEILFSVMSDNNITDLPKDKTEEIRQLATTENYNKDNVLNIILPTQSTEKETVVTVQKELKTTFTKVNKYFNKIETYKSNINYDELESLLIETIEKYITE